MLQLNWRHIKKDDEYRAQCGQYRLNVFMLDGEYRSEVSYNVVCRIKKRTQLPMVAMHRAERLLLRLVREDQRRLAKVELALAKPHQKRRLTHCSVRATT